MDGLFTEKYRTSEVYPTLSSFLNFIADYCPPDILLFIPYAGLKIKMNLYVCTIDCNVKFKLNDDENYILISYPIRTFKPEHFG